MHTLMFTFIPAMNYIFRIYSSSHYLKYLNDKDNLFWCKKTGKNHNPADHTHTKELCDRHINYMYLIFRFSHRNPSYSVPHRPTPAPIKSIE